MYLILWLSLQFEPVQETNLFLHWLHLLQQYKKGYMTVRHGLWLTKKKRNYSVWFYSELWYWISYILHWFKVWYPKTVLCMLTFILFLINFQDSTGKAINRKAVVCTFSVPQIHHLHIKQPPPLSQSICI